MVLIPAGDYWMGRTHTASLEQAIILERDRRDDQPAHKIFIDAFYLDTHEVTNADYAKFVAATNAAKPWHWPNGTVAKAEERWPSATSIGPRPTRTAAGPANGCRRKPEWERAARGGLDRKRYPWGDEGGRGRAHTGSPSGPTVVGSFAANAFGLFDMAGNVWEWTSDWYERDYYAVSVDRNPDRARNRQLSRDSRRRLDGRSPTGVVPQLC